MRRLALVLLLAAACSGGGPGPLEPARDAARARAEATEAQAKEACRARGEEVFEYGRGEWLCGEELAARRARAEAEWQERCAAEGARAYRGGPSGWFCANPTLDAGRECRSGAECQSHCILADEGDRTGTCAATTTVLGCFAEIGERGERGILCVD